MRKLSIKPSRSIINKVLAVLLLAVCLPVLAAQKQDEVFDCDTTGTGSVESRQQAANELLKHSYDISRLNCGANILIAIADEHPTDGSAQLSALKANARNIFYHDSIVLYQLGYLISWYVTEVPAETKLNAPMIALITAQQEQLRVLQQAKEAGVDAAKLGYYDSLAVGPVSQALPKLKPVVAADPPELNGAAHALLAQTYYTLPDMLGGDLDLAVDMMRAARERSPSDPRYARLHATYLLDVEQADEAITILKQILAMDPVMSGWQLQADELRVARQMADRIGDKKLAEQLLVQRNNMLTEHPYLQTRKTVSAMGHFGDKDPMADPDQSHN